MTEKRQNFYSPHYWECLCEIPDGIQRTNVIKCIECNLTQDQGTKVNVLDLLDHNIDPYPFNYADIISSAKVALDLISDVTIRSGRHASCITDELLAKNHFCQWTSGRMVEIVTDGIGVFIAKVMNRVSQLTGATITAIAIHKYRNERDDGNYIFVAVAVNGIWLMSDGMTDFSGAGGRAYQDMGAVLALWSWMYNAEIETRQHSLAAYKRLMGYMQKMFADEY